MYAPEDMPAPLSPVTENVAPPPKGLDAYYGQSEESSQTEVTDARAGDPVIGTPPGPYTAYTDQDWRIVRAVTAGMINQIDDCVGRILDALEAHGLSDNTIVVFASDHGDYLGDYGLYGKGLHYDCVLRTPLLMSGPGIPAGQVVEEMTSLVDVPPTLYDLAGLVEPEALQGISMAQALQQNIAWPRDAVLTENDDDMAGLRFRTLTTKNWKITVYAGQEFGELYDRENDPNERVNLWHNPEYTERKAQLLQQLTDHMLCAVDGANGRVQPPAPEIKKHVPRKCATDS